MKNLKNFNPSILFFVAVLISAFTTQAQNINFPDIHLKTVLLANTQVNTNGDNEIQKSEADAFSGLLDVSNSTIYDMTGIEYFTNMTSLNCSGNDLEEIYLAENTGLMRLDCNDNKLFELDVTNLTELMLLDCNTNSISNLNLNANTALIRLMAQNNQLEGLDLSANLALQKLDCSNNNLVYLDVSANNALKSINCSSNSLSELNLANHNNVNIPAGSIDATGNNLNCVQVDDQSYSSLNWNHRIDASAYYSNNCTALPLKEIAQNDFTFFPNPATDVVTVYLGGVFERISVEVVNTSGAVVIKNSYVNSKSVNIDLDVIPGIYLIAVNTGNGNTITKKLIKK
jgi:Leucine-rich repeat (LRR) protein